VMSTHGRSGLPARRNPCRGLARWASVCSAARMPLQNPPACAPAARGLKAVAA
jgi:hypothetical protein